jgi:flagellar biosynthesis component FlhA
VSRPRRLRWDVPESPPPKHPYRDSAIVYVAFAGIIVLIAWLTGGPITRAVVLAALFFVIACSWSWWRWHQKLTRLAREAATKDDAA